MARNRRAAERRGRRGERLAALALHLKGYRILARRYRTPLGEVDLIARRGNVLAFIEVKARATPLRARDAVTRKTWRRIAAAAEIWTANRAGFVHLMWRYDIMAVCPRRWPIHIRDAWRPDFAVTRA